MLIISIQKFVQGLGFAVVSKLMMYYGCVNIIDHELMMYYGCLNIMISSLQITTYLVVYSTFLPLTRDNPVFLFRDGACTLTFIRICQCDSGLKHSIL